MLNIKRDIQPLSTFKRNTNKLIEQMKQTGEPIILTVNGKAQLVVQDAVSYQKLLEQIEKLEILAGVREGLKDIEAGLGRESLYKALSLDGNPQFSTICKIVSALGLSISFQSKSPTLD
jgi:probable addiction module antidote protein